MEPVMRNNLLIFAGGLLVGGGATYLVVNQQLKKKYQAIADEEIDSVKQHYSEMSMRNKVGVYSDPANLVEEPAEEKSEQTKYEEVVSELEYETDDETVKKTVVKTAEGVVQETEEVEVRNIFDQPQPSIGQRDPEIPYKISTDEFMDDDLGFDKVTLTWFAGDNTLIDENEEPIPDVMRTVGEDNLLRFGEDSDDNDTVFVRNERINTDFEVVRDPQKYAVAVLGLFDEESMYTRSRKPKNDERDD